MRRVLVLSAVVAVALTLVLVLPEPPPRTGREAVRGPRLFKVPATAVHGVAVAVGERRVDALRTADGWAVGGKPAGERTRAAIDDLLATLETLRAVDRFRPEDGARFGLDPPRATIELVSPRGATRIEFGELNAANSAVYARRAGAPHVMLVGLYVISALERVLFFASADAAS